MTDIRQFRPSKREGRGVPSSDFVEGILSTNLNAATGATGKDAQNELTGHTTATLRVIEWSSGDDFYFTGQTITITNRSTTFSAGAGTYVVAFQIGGEFRPLPTFQTVRGRLMRALVSDDVIGWPKFGLMEVLGIGRLWGITTSNSSSPASTITASTTTPSDTITVTGDITSYATSGRLLRVTGSGTMDGDYTISGSSYSAPSTTITLSDNIATPSSSGTATVLGQFVIDGSPQSTITNIPPDVTDLILVGDTLSLWGLSGAYTVVTRSYSSGTKLTTINVAEALDSSTITAELTSTTVTAQTATTITVTGDVTPECVTGHFINVTDTGAGNGRFTIFDAEKAGSNTVITFNETASVGTVGGSSAITILRSLLQHTIHPDDRLTYTISSMTTGANGTVTITDPATVLTGTDPIDPDEMFLEGHLVEITGSTDGVNDGVYRCRKDFIDNGATITVYLDGTLATAATPGSLTLKVPPPLLVTHKSLAVLRWYRSGLGRRCIVHTLPPDGEGYHEIIACDIGPSDVPIPDDP